VNLFELGEVLQKHNEVRQGSKNFIKKGNSLQVLTSRQKSFIGTATPLFILHLKKNFRPLEIIPMFVSYICSEICQWLFRPSYLHSLALAVILPASSGLAKDYTGGYR
jgi:hypothetical protein